MGILSKKNSAHDKRVSSSLKEQDKSALAVMLKEHGEEGYVPFHMPGHKRNAEFKHLSGVQNIDITEIEGFDNLHDAKGIIKQAQDLAADYFGVLESRFLTCGSTAGVLTAIRTLTKRGDEVLIARNCHRSVFHAVELCGLKPFYVSPTYFEEYGFYGSVMPQDVQKAFDEHPNIKLVVITSPTYHGIISDIKSISAICHLGGAKLFVDEAHGSHLGLSRKFEQSARNLGADIVVNSLHKTLPSLTQTSILHVCTEGVDIRRLDNSLDMFETSSPSYVLMASIDGCVRYMRDNGAKLIDAWSDMIDKFRRGLSHCKRIKLFNGSREGGRVFAYDKSKLVFLTVDSALSGIELMRALKRKYKIELEAASANYAIAMTGAGDGFPAFMALSEAVFEIDNSVRERYGLVKIATPSSPEKALEPYETDVMPCDFANFDKSVGCVAAENVWVFPPSCPLIVKGEYIDQDFVRLALYLYECGVDVNSESGQFPDKILAVCEKDAH